VTGAAGGIGRAIALSLARAGGRVALLDRDEAGSAETLRRLQEAGADAVAVGCDVSDLESVAAAAEAVSRQLGPGGVLVNNAGLLRSGPASDAFAQRSAEGAVKLVAVRMGKEPADLKVWIEHKDSAFGTSIATEQQRLLKEAGVTHVGIGAHSAQAVDLSDSILRARNFGPELWLSTAYVADRNLLLRTACERAFKPGAMMLVGTGDTFETLDAVGKDALEGVLLVSYPRADVGEAYAPGAAKFLAAYRAKYNRDPIAPQAMSAYVGMRALLGCIAAAGTPGYEGVIAAAAKVDKPFGTYETGYGLKFDKTMQNIRALPLIAQWQDGRVVAVYPARGRGAGHADGQPGAQVARVRGDAPGRRPCRTS